MPFAKPTLGAAVLEVEGLRAWYGPTQALFDVSLNVHPGETVALVGPNGAGKSTVIRSILGLIRTDGHLAIEGTPLRDIPAHERVRRLQVAVVHEGRGLFTRLSVRENILVGINHRRADQLDEALELFPKLRGRLPEPVTVLSGGEQQMVALARAFLSRPRLLLLDEPSLGLAPIVVDEIYGTLRKLREGGVTTLLVEPSVPRARSLANRLVLLQGGVSRGSVSSEDEVGVEQLMNLVHH